MNLTFTVTQFSEDGIGPESPKKTLPIGEVLFQEIRCFFGVLPRFDVLNDILRRGQIMNTENQQFQWNAFELTDLEYEDLRQEVLSHPEWDTDVDETFTEAIPEWSHWALVRALNK